MPIYEYKCSACGHGFEKLIRSAADLPGKCPECGKKTLRKQFSTFSARVTAGACKFPNTCPSAGAHRHSGGCCGTGKCEI